MTQPTHADPPRPPSPVSPARADSPRAQAFWFTWAIVAAFGSYFCMYGFRKPFTAGSYSGPTFAGLELKTILVTAQVIGYTISKFIGIKVIAEMPPARRAAVLLALIAVAQLALVAFGLVPRPWNAACLFLNGLPLGMVFGLVLGFLEGRRVTEALTAGLCASFILADGVTKSVGTWLLRQGVLEDWMPAVAGLIFLPGLLLGVAMLRRVPRPTDHDVAARSERSTLDGAGRAALFGRYALGIALLTIVYLLLTIIRSLRADFAPELWRAMGSTASPQTFAGSELLVALGVLASSACFVFIRDNRRAFFASLGMCAAGMLLLMGALLGRSTALLDPFPFMVLIGLGMYLPYVAVHTTVFERLLAMTRDKGNIGYLMYLADAFGYLGYVAVMLTKGTLSKSGDTLALFTAACWITAGLSLACLVAIWLYFLPRSRTRPAPGGLAAAA